MTSSATVDDTGKEMVVKAELPGVTEKDVEVNLAGDVLTIKGEKKAEHEEKRRFLLHGAPLRLVRALDPLALRGEG